MRGDAPRGPVRTGGAGLARRLERTLRAREHTVMLILASLIGLLGGFGSVLFRELIRLVQAVAWGDQPYGLDLVREHPWWWIALAPAAGGLIVGPLVMRFAREARGHGVPEVMEAVALRSGFIRPRLAAVKALASAITIGTGGSVGREGPIVQIGAAAASTVGQLARVSGPQLRTLVGCGAAAGVAGTFNAPVAGALFAVEIVLGDFAVAEFSPIVISSVLATVISRYYLGDFPAFPVPPHELVSGWELGAYAVLGLVAAGVGLLFVSLLYGLEDRFDRWSRVPEWLRPAIGGGLVGLIGIGFPEILGVGYEATSAALAGQLGLLTVATLILVKMAATAITLASGGSGGVFAPSLFLGAMTGALVGGLANHLFPALTGTQGAYALVGMGAVVAGTTQAPITAILIIFELTSDYKLILPLMVSAIIATVVSTRVRRTSIYTEKLRRRGIDLFRGHELNLLRGVRTEDVMEPDPVTTREDRPLSELLDLLAQSPRNAYYVTGSDGRLVGVIRRPELQDALGLVDTIGPVVVARDLVGGDPQTIDRREPLDTAMRIFAERQPEELPVVDEEHRVVGTVTRGHVIEAYNRELVKRDMAAGLGRRLDSAGRAVIRIGDGHAMAEVDAPPSYAGRTLGELALRRRYGIQVVLVRRADASGDAYGDRVAGPDTRIRPGDRLVLLGPEDEVTRLSR
jgi:CIC family chloride channel protein